MKICFTFETKNGINRLRVEQVEDDTQQMLFNETTGLEPKAVKLVQEAVPDIVSLLKQFVD